MILNSADLYPSYVECPSGLLLPEDIAQKRYTPAKLPVGIDLFSGCGGFSLGFIKGGFEVVAACEWECAAAETYMCNLSRYGELKIHFVEKADEERFEKYLNRSMKRKAKKGVIDAPIMAGSGWIKHQPPSVPGVKHFFMGDIRKLPGDRILEAIGMKKGEVGCVFGGPPCQGFSTSGKRNVMDPRNSMVFEFARMVLDINPKTMVFENVPGITNMVTPEGVPVLDAFGRILEDGSFMTVDALKQSLLAQHGSLGLMRTRGAYTKKQQKKEKLKRQKEQLQEAIDDEQGNLFGELT